MKSRHGPPPEHYPRGPCSPPPGKSTGGRARTASAARAHGRRRRSCTRPRPAHVSTTSQRDMHNVTARPVGEVSSTRARQPPDSTSDHAYAVKSCFRRTRPVLPHVTKTAKPCDSSARRPLRALRRKTRQGVGVSPKGARTVTAGEASRKYARFKHSDTGPASARRRPYPTKSSRQGLPVTARGNPRRRPCRRGRGRAPPPPR